MVVGTWANFVRMTLVSESALQSERQEVGVEWGEGTLGGRRMEKTEH